MTFARTAIGSVGCLLSALALSACGEATVGSASKPADPAAKPTAHAGTVSPAVAVAPNPSSKPGVAREAADPLEADSYPAPASVKHASAAAPAKAGEAVLAAGAPSNAEVRKELEQMQAVQRSETQNQRRALTPVPGGESIGGVGTIPIPADIPEVVQKVIAGANEIADFPYVYGGGHASFIDDAYDCSGSVSYALAAGGLLSSPETSGELESWGVPGPGRYITVYANAGHTYMYVDGLLYDTAGRSGVYASRWQVQPTDNAGYVVRHWPGL
jgi:cell wall-associated NlpC family hydrolase